MIVWGCSNKPNHQTNNTTQPQDTTANTTPFPELRADTTLTPSQMIIGHWKQTQLYFDGPLPIDKDEATKARMVLQNFQLVKDKFTITLKPDSTFEMTALDLLQLNTPVLTYTGQYFIDSTGRRLYYRLKDTEGNYSPVNYFGIQVYRDSLITRTKMPIGSDLMRKYVRKRAKQQPPKV
jgi:hypothetical protein